MRIFVGLVWILIGLVGCSDGSQPVALPVEEQETVETFSEEETLLEVEEAVETFSEDEPDLEEEQLSFFQESLDLSGYFYGLDGTAVFLLPEKGEYIFREDMADLSFSPFSTFKIFSTLICLKEGIVTSGESRMEYSGQTYWNSQWDEDLNLEESFQRSCVWFYHQMIYRLSQSDVAKHLEAVSYGNCDLSAREGQDPGSDLSGFWLGSSLEITPRQQVAFLAQVFQGETDYEAAQVGLLQDFMATDRPGVFGKTGASSLQSWFVGFFQQDEDAIYFAVFAEDSEKLSVSGKEIALAVIDDWEKLV